MPARHVPVLLERCLELLDPALSAPGRDGRDAVYLDATLGLGGHAEAVLRAHEHLVLVGLDRDPQALRLAGERLASYADQAMSPSNSRRASTSRTSLSNRSRVADGLAPTEAGAVRRNTARMRATSSRGLNGFAM